MNKSGQNTPDQGHDEREWQAQERARREVRSGFEATSDDTAMAQYRDIAKALRQPPPAGLPVDFAAHVARIAERQAAAPVAETRFEQVLVRLLAAAFVLSAVAALAIYGGRLLSMLQAATGSEGLQWVLVLSACVGLSWSLDWTRRRLRDDHDGGPMRVA